MWWWFRKLCLLLLFFFFFFSTEKNTPVVVVLVQAAIQCNRDDACTRILGVNGTSCVNGICTNPFHYGGCLYNMLPKNVVTNNNNNRRPFRICHSEDPTTTTTNTSACHLVSSSSSSSSNPNNHNHNHIRHLDYTEIRIASQNWETSFLGAWILQIVLSELLHVPVTIETGVANQTIDFYNLENKLDYGGGSISYDWDGLQQSATTGDCRTIKQQQQQQNNNDKDNTNHKPYQSCCHVIPEVWEEEKTFNDNDDNDDNDDDNNSWYFEKPPLPLGALGEQHWFIPKFTAQRDPTLTTYIGLQHNRTKLAETFLRPTTWNDYCQQVSLTNCTVPNEIAQRAPMTEIEANSYHVPRWYTGHFRKTEDNNCTLHPTTCTGHIADYPCGWNSYTIQQAYHLNISLKSNGPPSDDNNKESSSSSNNGGGGGGYSYAHLTQIWAAANATRSNVIFLWWTPERLYQQYIGTSAEFTRVVLPPPTQTCVQHRITQQERCNSSTNNGTNAIVVGSPLGACDTSPQILTKIIGTSLKQISQNPNIPRELWSPAYEVVQRYQMTTFQLDQILNDWQQRQTDPWGYDPREATCRWVVNNLEMIQNLWIPEYYPRTIVEYTVASSTTPNNNNNHNHNRKNWILTTAQVVSSSVLALIVVCAIGIYIKRKTTLIVHAQMEFLYFLLTGFAVIVIGAFMLVVVPPNDTLCTVVLAWLTNLGYCLELVPVVIRMEAIHRLNHKYRNQMQHVRLAKRKLLVSVGIGLSCIGIFVLVWTLVNPPQVDVDYILLVDEKNDNQQNNKGEETIVEADIYCAGGSSDNGILFPILSIAWQAVLLLYALILAFLASRVREDLNETRIFATLIFSQFLFVCFRLVLLLTTTTTTTTTTGVDSSSSSSSSMNKLDLMGYTSLIMSADCFLALLIFVIPKLVVESEDNKNDNPDEPLPDLFLHTTIMLADIVGFTAWSSVREPCQVFKFLEAVYGEFDDLAEERMVFKVETIADCYVAATGIPTFQKDHALEMARFATECMLRMNSITKDLELKYGPDTGELSLRIGMHSGPVTGGFLRGKNARFQLFGETMSTTGLMEKTCLKGRIQVSEDTAKLIIKGGKQRWLEKREEGIVSKRDEPITTYWLNKFKPGRRSSVGSSQNDSSAVADGDHELWLISQDQQIVQRKQRLIDWNVEVLQNALRQIIARRKAARTLERKNTSRLIPLAEAAEDISSLLDGEPRMPMDEVKEIIEIPEFDAKIARKQKDAATIEIPLAVSEQLKVYVTAIAEKYRENPFHNFGHASHVVMAVIKLMNRIIAPPDVVEDDELKSNKKKIAATLHDYTYGITSDPLTQFACLFSALIHDVDHPGVPNPQLVKENKQLAEKYRCRSVAEQNSFDLSWNLLMEERFDELREAICESDSELKRFRELVINSVMATDFGDKELKEISQKRWEKAFSVTDEEVLTISGAREAVNRKATIVIEHLILAADVSHTMQHWHVYREWNEKLFREIYNAYRDGRAEKSPVDFWYEGELGFFDFYIIPLTKKLSDCGVFGISSNENLNYAMRNRAEWAARGQEILSEMIETYCTDMKQNGDTGNV